jgi:pimeloyl-ACP methyl ester carboxylesterase
MAKTVTAFFVSGRRFPDRQGHDQAEDDRDAFIDQLRGLVRYSSVEFRPWAWDGPPVNLDTDVGSERILLVGYSYGGNTTLMWAAQAKEGFVDHLMLLDPVNPANFLWPLPPFDVPPAVRRADCYVRCGLGHLPLPASRRINANRPGLNNHDIDDSHQNFYRNQDVHKHIIAALDELLHEDFVPWKYAPFNAPAASLT